MDGYAGCGRGCMSKRQPLLKRFYYRRAWRLFCWRMSGHPGGRRARCARRPRGLWPRGMFQGRAAALEPPPPRRGGRSIPGGSSGLPLPAACLPPFQRQGKAAGVPGGGGGGRRARSALNCWGERPQAARPSSLFGRPGGQGPRAAKRRRPPRASPPRRQAGLGC